MIRVAPQLRDLEEIALGRALDERWAAIVEGRIVPFLRGGTSLYVKDLGSISNGTANATAIITLNATPSAANSVVVVAMCNSTQTILSAADSKGNAWALDAGINNNGTTKQSVGILSTTMNVAQLVSGDTITVTYSASNTDKAAAAIEIAGKITKDKTATAAQTATTAASTGASAATTTAVEIAVGAFACGALQASWTPDATYTAPTLNIKNPPSNTRSLVWEYKDLAATAAQTATGTLATSATVAAALVTYSSTAGVSPPVNTVAPVASGTATVGSTVSVTNGTWTDAGSPAFTYQWQRDVAGNSVYSNIGGATSSSKVLVDADDACHVRCVVTDTDVNGATAANSNALGVVAEPVPANTVAPAVSGLLPIGSTLTTTDGTWNNMGGTVHTFAYQWTRDGVNIGGATASTYVTVTADGGHAIGCKVTATNTGGSATQASSNTIGTSAARPPFRVVARRRDH